MSSQYPSILYPQGGLCRLPLPHKITSMQDTQEPTHLYKYIGNTWKLVQSK